MSAAAYILLVLGIIGLLMGCYYGLLCYPILKQDNTENRPINPERKHLISDNPDHNDNSTPSAPETVPDDIPIRPIPKQSKLEDAYPSVPNSSHSLNADDSFGSEVPIAAASIALHKKIDEPDRASPSIKESVIAENIQKRSKQVEINYEVYEMNPLLHGDDEDGLIVYPQTARSKTTEEPVPPPKPPHITIKVAETERDITSVEKPPQSIEPLEQNRSTSEEHVPKHIVLTMYEPQIVPPEVNMATSHPPSHMVVTVAQPLNVPPLMVAPVYDEPPLDEQPAASLQHQLYPIISNSCDDHSICIAEAKPSEIPESQQSHAYGWNDNVSPEEKMERTGVENSRNEENEPEIIACKNSTLPIVVGEIVKVTPTKEINIATQNAESFTAASNESIQASHLPNDDLSDGTDTSEGEITEYTFETDLQLPSTSAALADEIGASSEVKIVRYSSINESVLMEGDASINDSTRVHVGDLDHETVLNKDIKQLTTEQVVEERAVAPDLSISRQSPDGDSLKSLDGENGTSPVKELQSSSPKDKTQSISAVQTIV